MEVSIAEILVVGIAIVILFPKKVWKIFGSLKYISYISKVKLVKP